MMADEKAISRTFAQGARKDQLQSSYKKGKHAYLDWDSLLVGAHLL